MVHVQHAMKNVYIVIPQILQYAFYVIPFQNLSRIFVSVLHKIAEQLTLRTLIYAYNVIKVIILTKMEYVKSVRKIAYIAIKENA